MTISAKKNGAVNPPFGALEAVPKTPAAGASAHIAFTDIYAPVERYTLKMIQEAE